MLCIIQEVYNEECGKWNTSLTCKWIDYEETRFFEEHFKLQEAKNIFNIGIGPGIWDRYLAYHMPDFCILTSIDIDPDITNTFQLCLENEENQRNITIINQDFFTYNLDTKFDIITLVGSAVLEIGKYQELFQKALSLLNNNGELYYMTVDPKETKDNVLQALDNTNCYLELYDRLEKYNVEMTLVKIKKA